VGDIEASTLTTQVLWQETQHRGSEVPVFTRGWHLFGTQHLLDGLQYSVFTTDTLKVNAKIHVQYISIMAVQTNWSNVIKYLHQYTVHILMAERFLPPFCCIVLRYTITIARI